VDETANVLATQSGLAGLSGLSGEIPDLEEAADAGDVRARLALDVYVTAIRHYLGAFLVTLGGLDVLTFSGGIGERGGRIRKAVCSGLQGLGIRLANEQPESCRNETKISAEDSAVEVHVIPANEEGIVARAAAEVVSGKSQGTLSPARV
jgi:acetate kinase